MAEKSSSSSGSPAKVNTIPWILLVIAAFVIGALWTQVRMSKQGTNVIGQAAGNTAGNTVGNTAPGESPLSIPKLKAYAQELKMDTNKFNTCLDKKSFSDAVRKSIDYGSSVGVGGTPAFFINGYLVSGAQPFDNFKKIIDYLLTGGTLDSKNLPADVDALVKQGAVSVEKKTIDSGSAPVKGNPNGKINLVEFSDFECPFCQRSYRTVKQIVDTYGKDLRLTYLEFPLTQIHPHSQDAAEAASCAADQGKFWEYHDKLFESQGA